MKRCPQCLFLYPDSDVKCDFDQTTLEAVDDSAVDAATRPKSNPGVLPIAAVIGVLLGVLGVAIYFGFNHQTQTTSATAPAPSTTEPVASPSPAPATPSPSPLISPSPSPSPTAKPAEPKISTAHTRATSDPVSTSGPGIGTRQGAKPAIMLTSGGKIDADEVWRTKDGVWYRRNGIVTLLKRGQVKAIVTR
jgi:hypothetical protein